MSDTTELVDLAVIFPDLEIELKYACADNITGTVSSHIARARPCHKFPGCARRRTERYAGDW